MAQRGSPAKGFLGNLATAPSPTSAAAGPPSATANERGDEDVTDAGAAVRTLVIPAREDVEIARQVRSLLR